MSILKIEDLKKSYSNPDGEKISILDIAEFQMDAEQQMGVKGSSGCGKTTFLHLIAGILTPDSGTIFIDGTDITKQNESARDQIRATNVGYIFQTFNLLQGYTALENVTLAMLLAGQNDSGKAKELLERVGLKDRYHYRPSQLSIGQQQRVAVARALATKPRLVLADEPTGNLDARNAQTALKLIREVCQENQAALLLVSHDPSILEQFSEVKEMASINKCLAKVESNA